jgi:1-acyl-sn-glycerol-3-phosphate acyltransferase
MESVGRKYLRRVVTIPSCALLFATVWSALPLLLGLAALVDVVRGRGFVVIRTVTCIAWYLACEIAGLVFALALWVVYRLSARRGREAFVRRNHRLLDLWARAVGRVSFRLFSLDFFVEGDEAFGRRPVLLLLRHASVVDAVLVALLVSGVRGIRLRYVFERKLLWDPFVDVVGNRLPNYFVPRGGVHTIQQIDAAAHVADGMAAGEGAVIYPEEAKFSSTVRKRLIEEFRERGDEPRAVRAAVLEHVLLPKPSGTLAFVEKHSGKDLVFCSHTGLEPAASFRRMWNGELVGKTIHVMFWKSRAEDVPKDRDSLETWMFEQWRIANDFVAEYAGDQSGG